MTTSVSTSTSTLTTSNSCWSSSANSCQTSSTWMSSLNQLPNDLFTNREIFLNLFISSDNNVWHHLNDTKRQELLNNYLPEELSNEDKKETIEELMNGSLNRFNVNSLSNCFVGLKSHKISQDLVKTLEDVKSLKKRLFRLYDQKRQSLLLKEVIQKRQLLLEESIQTNQNNGNKSIERKNTNKTLLISESKSLKERVRLRYRKELKEIRNKADTSSEEEDLSRTVDKTLSSMSKLNGNPIPNPNPNPISDKQYNEMLRKHKRKRKAKDFDNSYEPTLETNNITLSDIITRVTNSAITSNPTNTCVTKTNRTNSLSQTHPNSALKSSSSSAPKKKAKHLSVDTKGNQTNQSIPSNPIKVLPKSHSPTIKVENESTFETELSNKSDFSSKQNSSDIKVIDESSDRTISGSTKTTAAVTTKPSSSLIPPVVSHSESQLIAAPLPALPVLMPSTANVPLEANPAAVTPTPLPFEKEPKCFFSLLRDVFASNASTDQRLTLHKLEELIKERLRSFSPLIGWSTEMVASAMNYLSGVLPPPHLVPLVDYKEKNQQWQWIGGGRDGDQELAPLCEQWMKNKDEDLTAGLISFSQSLPPPAKCLTDWVVRPSSDDEKSVYRTQEAVRYHNPYKAFTYRVHGYESVVGPVKGCGIGAANGHNTSSPNKAREHSLLVSDRPPFVTLLSLVRDAAARLPNGEGTRADICELLKDSQYLLPTISDQQVNGIVSGALDRLHYEKDPCVKYDVNRKVWIYLHRNRTEAEFERLHEVQIAAAKAKRSMSKASRKTNCVNNQSNPTGGQLSIISKTTQQAIHQAVTNILNSEALKITTKSNSSVSVDSLDNPVVSSTIEALNPNKGLVSDLKTTNSLFNTNKEKDLIAFESKTLSPFNGSTPSAALSSKSLFLSLQPKNQIQCKSDAITSSSNISQIDKKMSTKPKDNKPFETQKSLKILDNKQSIVLSNRNSYVSQPSASLSVAANALNSSDVTKLIANESNCIKALPKTRTVRQTKPSIKVQIPKTIGLPIHTIPVSQNSLKAQTSITTCMASEPIPALINMTNPTNKVTTLSSTPSQQQTKSLTTKMLSGTHVNSMGTGSTSNQMHQISIPTSVLFGTRPASVVLATPTGKSYMMSTAGQLVLHPNTTSPAISSSSETPTSQTSSLAVRTLQGIRVIPVNANPNTTTKIHTPITAKSNASNASVVMATQAQPLSSATISPHHQFVARIITTAQTTRGNVPQTQIVIPSTSALQPLFLAHPTSQTSATSQTILQQMTSTTTITTAQLSNELQKGKVGLTLPPRTTS